MPDIAFAFEIVVVGVLGFLPIAALVHIVVVLWKGDARLFGFALHSVGVGEGDEGGEANDFELQSFFKYGIALLLVGFAYVLGSLVFIVADELFDYDTLLTSADDAIKVEVYKDKLPWVEQAHFHQDLTESLNVLREAVWFEKKEKEEEKRKEEEKERKGEEKERKGEEKRGAGTGHPENKNKVGAEELRQAVRHLYDAQKYIGLTGSDKSYNVLQRLKATIIVLRGCALNLAILFGLLVISLFVVVTRRQKEHVLGVGAHIVSLLVSGVFAVLCALGWESTEKEYNEHVIGLHRALRPEVVSRDWIDRSIGSEAPEVLNAFIEIKKGTARKLEIDVVTGRLVFDRYVGPNYPQNYGSLPGTLGGDLDPLDVIVLGDEIEVGNTVRVWTKGVLKMTDDGERDEKIVATLDQHEEVSEGEGEKLAQWFRTYKDPEEGKIENVSYDGLEDAKKIVERAITAFENRYGAAPKK